MSNTNESSWASSIEWKDVFSPSSRKTSHWGGLPLHNLLFHLRPSSIGKCFQLSVQNLSLFFPMLQKKKILSILIYPLFRLFYVSLMKCNCINVLDDEAVISMLMCRLVEDYVMVSLNEMFVVSDPRTADGNQIMAQSSINQSVSSFGDKCFFLVTVYPWLWLYRVFPCVSPPSCVRGPPCSLLSWSPLITHTCHHQAPHTAVHHAGWTSTLLHIVPSVAAPSGWDYSPCVSPSSTTTCQCVCLPFFIMSLLR